MLGRRLLGQGEGDTDGFFRGCVAKLVGGVGVKTEDGELVENVQAGSGQRQRKPTRIRFASEVISPDYCCCRQGKQKEKERRTSKGRRGYFEARSMYVI